MADRKMQLLEFRLKHSELGRKILGMELAELGDKLGEKTRELQERCELYKNRLAESERRIDETLYAHQNNLAQVERQVEQLQKRLYDALVLLPINDLLPKQDDRTEFQIAVENKNKIYAIKIMRAATGLSLLHAKNLVEAHFIPPVPVENTSPAISKG